jgi:hypothetical protein
MRDKILSVYLPWRNQLLDEWARRIGKRVLVISC